MSNREEKSYVTNGVISEPMQRLASFKTPRDLTLGGIKPSKKVFTPNLNVIRKKTKGPAPLSANTNNHIKDDSGKRERRNDRNKHESNILKSSGVFSEGVGKIERQNNRESYRSWSDGGGDVMQKPALRLKKIDQDLEDQKTKTVTGREDMVDHVMMDFRQDMELDAPVQLPMGLGSSVNTNYDTVRMKMEPSIKKEPFIKQEPNVKNEPYIKSEPMDVDMDRNRKFLMDVKRALGDKAEAADLLQATDPTLLLLQLPAALPGRGGPPAEDPPRRKPAATAAGTAGPSGSSAAAPQPEDDDNADEPCQLRSLEEGRIGTLRVHRSGRVTMQLGTTNFEVSKGMKTSFYQEVVSVGVDDASRSANMISLGPLEHRLTAVPDWDSLFAAPS